MTPAVPTAAHEALSNGDVNQVLKLKLLLSASAFSLTRGGCKQ